MRFGILSKRCCKMESLAASLATPDTALCESAISGRWPELDLIRLGVCKNQSANCLRSEIGTCYVFAAIPAAPQQRTVKPASQLGIDLLLVCSECVFCHCLFKAARSPAATYVESGRGCLGWRTASWTAALLLAVARRWTEQLLP